MATIPTACYVYAIPWVLTESLFHSIVSLVEVSISFLAGRISRNAKSENIVGSHNVDLSSYSFLSALSLFPTQQARATRCDYVVPSLHLLPAHSADA